MLGQFARIFSKHKLLLISLLVNIALATVCWALFFELKETYKQYRHFRSLPIGISLATNAKPMANSIVLFGDSRIETWHPDPYSDKFRFINAGVTGETTTEMLRRFERDVVALKPEFVLIQAGVNDLTAAVTKGMEQPEFLLRSMQDNLKYFIETLEQQDIDVLVTSIIPAKYLNFPRRLFWHNTLNDKILLANEKLNIMTESLGANWLDLDPLFRDESGNPVNDLYVDTLHINHEGYDILNSYLKDYIDNF